MKMQIKITSLCIQKCIKWFFVLLGITIIYIMSIVFVKKVDYNDIAPLLGVFRFKNFNYLAFLVLIFQFFITIYYSFIYYTFEIREKYDNILFRVCSKKWLKSKIILQLVMVAIFHILYSFFILSILEFNILDYIEVVFETSILHIFLSILVIVLYNFFNENSFFICIVLLICFLEIIFYDYVFFFNIVIGIILICYEYFTFSLKKLFKKV